MATTPDESSQFELQPMLGYDSVNNENDGNVVSGDQTSLSPSKSTTNDSSSSATNIDDEDEDLQDDDERLWIKLFPWLLKWSWFRKRRYKSPNRNS